MPPNDQTSEFFKGQYFAQLGQSIADIKEAQDNMQKDISDIKGKIIYMYGFATAIGLVGSFLIDYARTTIFNVPH